MKIFSKLAIGVLLLIGVVGCHSSKNAGNNLTGNPKHLKDESCAFKYDEGGTFENESDELKTTYFSKVYGVHHLKNVYHASAAQTYNYMTGKGQVSVFRGTDTNEGCSMFRSFPEADSELQKFWDEAAGDGEGTLLGVYLPENYTELPGREATIVVRNDTSRYTLVHEFMHHLFELEGIKAQKSQRQTMTGYADSNTKLQQKVAELQKAESISDMRTALQEMSDIMAQFLFHYDDLLVGSALEEMTIESELMNGFDKFTYLPRMFDDSKSYIAHNYKKGLELYNDLNEQLNSFDELLAQANIWGIRVNNDKYLAAKNQISNRKSEMKSVYLQSLRVPSLRTMDLSGLLYVPTFYQETIAEQKAVCPHTQAVINLIRNSQLGAVNF